MVISVPYYFEGRINRHAQAFAGVPCRAVMSRKITLLKANWYQKHYYVDTQYHFPYTPSHEDKVFIKRESI
jgi:hypothetical protein